MNIPVLPNYMKFVEFKKFGGPEQLMLNECPLPSLYPGSLLVRVAAAGVNRPDVLQRQGKYIPPTGGSNVLGLEISGEVVAVSKDTSRFIIGDRICALVPGGGYAEYSVVHESHALPIPKSFSWYEAAALPETFFTVWSNVFQQNYLAVGDILLVHGGTSGIGTVAVMLGHIFGARVFTTAGSAIKCQALMQLGADAAINYHEQDFVSEVKRLTNGKGADVIIDLVAGDYVSRNYEVAAINGKIIQIGIQHGSAPNLDLMPLMMKRLIHTGSTLRGRSVEEKAIIANELQQQVWPLLNEGRIRPIIDSIFKLANVANAHRLMETSDHIGKIILKMPMFDT